MSERAVLAGPDLRTRLSVLQAFRLGAAAAIAITGVADPSRFSVSAPTVVLSAIVYGASTAVVELARRRRRARALRVIRLLAVLDLIFITGFHGWIGDIGGVLAAVPLVHVVAVSLTLSLRTGVHVTLGHVAFLFAALVDRTAADTVDDPDAYPAMALTVLAVGGAVVALTWLRERAHERDLGALDALAGFAQDRERDGTAAGICVSLATRVRDAAGFADAAVALEDPPVPIGGTDTTTRLVRHLDMPVLAAALDAPDDVVVVPLTADGLRYATAGFRWDRGHTIPARTVELVEQFCGHAALGLHNAALQHHIAQLASRDQLTGLPNRRSFDERLVAEYERYRRSGTPLALAIIDVDHFKAVNDDHGHAVGDDVLRHLGATLQNHTRAADLPARFGGEEFAVLLCGATVREARLAAERYRVALGDGTGPVPFTVSIGVAGIPDSAPNSTELFEAADAALYRAKTQGRNQVRTAPRARRRRALHAA